MLHINEIPLLKRLSGKFEGMAEGGRLAVKICIYVNYTAPRELPLNSNLAPSGNNCHRVRIL